MALLYNHRGKTAELVGNLKADGSDETATFQAFIDAAYGPKSSGTQGGNLSISGGTIGLSDTILIQRKALIIEGNGWGNPTTYAPNPGLGTTFEWLPGAPTDRPMFQVEDSMGMVFRNMKFQGNNTNPPLAAIRFHHPGSIGHGNNTHLVLENLYIGRYGWTEQGLNEGDVQYGVLIDGTSGNNDQMHFSRLRIKNATVAGVLVEQTQSVWNLFEHCACISCAVGLSSNADLTALNCMFANNALDLDIKGTALANIFAYQSEHAEQLLTLGPNAKVFVDGGYSVLDLIDPGANLLVDGSGSQAGQTLAFRNHHFRQIQTPKPTILMKPTTGLSLSAPSMVAIENCFGITPDMLDVDLVDTDDRRHVVWRSPGGVSFRRYLSGTNSTVGVAPAALPAVTGSWGDGSAGVSLAAALANLGLIDDQTTA